ncbi:MAG: peptidase U32 family protein [Alphaproteobacteria bacterium]
MPVLMATRPELVCPAGTPASLRTAVDAGADAVYCGFRDATNARNFPGLNFSVDELAASLAYAHAHGTKVLLAINTFPPAGETDLWRDAIDRAVALGVDAVIIADIGVADYAARNHPKLRLHLSVQAGAPSVDAIRFYCEAFDVKRVVLPRILTVAEIRELKREVPCEIETFIFGNHGLMAEGRCSLTNYVTGVSTNMDGACSPADHVHYVEDANGSRASRLGVFTIDCFACDQKAGYPTICKGRYFAGRQSNATYAFEEPLSLNLAELFPELVSAGVSAFKIEGRQRSRAYVREVVSAWRHALDELEAGRQPILANLVALSEGGKQSPGAFASKLWR